LIEVLTWPFWKRQYGLHGALFYKVKDGNTNKKNEIKLFLYRNHPVCLSVHLSC